MVLGAQRESVIMTAEEKTQTLARVAARKGLPESDGAPAVAGAPDRDD